MTISQEPSSRGVPVPALLIGLGVLVIIGYLVFTMTGMGADSAVPATSTTEALPFETAEPPTPTREEPSERVTEQEPVEEARETTAVETTVEETNEQPDPLLESTDGDASLTEEAAVEQLANYAYGYNVNIPKQGQWVAQLSSKYIGVSDPLLTAANGTHTFYATDILAEFEQIARSVSGVQVVLLDSRDYGKQQLIDGKNLWVTFGLSDYFTSEDDVLAWCADEFSHLEGRERLNVCMPNKLNPPQN